MINELYEKAKVIGNNPKLLEKRLKEFMSCLKDTYRKDFEHYKFDFESKAIIGEKYVIKWSNTGITSEGQCCLYRMVGYL